MPRRLPQKARKQNTGQSQGHDQCQTPPYALAPILPYIPRDRLIWEPCAGEGLIVTALLTQGYTVQYGDLLTGQDFFKVPVPAGNPILLTNPPYSVKYQFIARCYSLAIPFAVLIPVSSLGAAGLNALLDKFGGEIMLLNKRVNYKMPLKGYSGKGAQFASMWYCHKVLPKPLMVGKIYPPKKQTVPAGIVQESLL